MKKYFKILIILILLIFGTLTYASSFVDSVDYHDTKLVKAFEDQTIAEYIPQGETLDNWTKLFAVRVFQNSPSSEESIYRLTKILTPVDPEQASSSKVINSHSSTEKNTHFIAFLTNDRNIIEYNVFRYIDIGPGRVILFQLAKRYYIEDREKTEEAFTWMTNQVAENKEDIIFLFDDKLAKRILES